MTLRPLVDKERADLSDEAGILLTPQAANAVARQIATFVQRLADAELELEENDDKGRSLRTG